VGRPGGPPTGADPAPADGDEGGGGRSRSGAVRAAGQAAGPGGWAPSLLPPARSPNAEAGPEIGVRHRAASKLWPGAKSGENRRLVGKWQNRMSEPCSIRVGHACEEQVW
jgi:hypothetical protein